MGSVWLFGFLAIILYRAFYAGMNSETLFYSYLPRGFSSVKIFDYILLSGGIAITWPISLPVIGIYKLGQRFNKEK